MAGAIVTARIDQYQFDKINKLVSDGIFNSRSAVIQTFVELGLEHCNLEQGAETLRQVSAEYRAQALAVTQEATIRELVLSITEELSWLIETNHHKEIVDRLAYIEDYSVQLVPEIYQRLIELLEIEPVYQVAQRMVREKIV